MISALTRNATRRPTVALHLVHRGFAHLPEAFLPNNRMASAQTPTFSTMAAHRSVVVSDAIDSNHSTQGKGTITKTLKALDMAVVRQIKAELLSVDKNNDGRQVQPDVCAF